MSEWTVERRAQQDHTLTTGAVMITPMVEEDYWTYRVRMNESGQAILAFPKFGTIGIGFAQEDDWNTNLPYTCPAEVIADHIAHNAGDESITRDRIVGAIEAIQQVIAVDVEARAATAE